MNVPFCVLAAHCVRNEDGKTYAPEDIMVGVGKLYNHYNDPRDKLAEYYEVGLHFVYIDTPNTIYADIFQKSIQSGNSNVSCNAKGKKSCEIVEYSRINQGNKFR